MKVTGRKICSMDLELKNIQMEKNIKEILLWEANLVKASINFMMAEYIKANFIMDSVMEMEFS